MAVGQACTRPESRSFTTTTQATPRGPAQAARLGPLVGILGLVLAACSPVSGSAAPAASVATAAVPVAGVGKSAAPPSTAVTTPASGAVPGRAPRGSAPSGSSIPAAPAAGLPRSTPLPDDVLVDSRVVDGVSDLYLVDTRTDAGTAEPEARLTGGLGGGQYPILSPDRATIIYLWHGPDGATVHVMAADGSGDRPLLTEATAATCPNPDRPAWNPVDPTEIALTCRSEDGSQLHLVGVDGAVRRTLDPGMTVFEDPTFSPDGRRIAIWGSTDTQAGGGVLAVLPADGSGPARPVTRPGEAQDVDPMWTVDGSALVFRRSVPGSEVAQILAVQVAATDGGVPDGGPVTPVTDGSAFDFDPTVAPDGRRVAFKSNRIAADGSAGDHVWVVELDGSGLRQLAADSAGASAGAPEWGRR
ncbi:hypothetical protein FDO65_03135 [Nakamurella flava]|uniref:Lipoprotein LpqB beta-propeller domain-containing protein n=1 Tax=Nakamurella flava TaxID=2576308 RepID=A0A4U6QKN5_9ACTN|nr:PD40 domain-containing protein [Nakamurella flava]TKV60696.1 hypothetical protein FDO65_03135 [Nakamurella flava]